MRIQNKNNISFSLGILGCLLVRLLPFRIPNVEPILATVMPFSKRYGALYGFVFGAASIILYDLATGTVGIWTLFTAITYGLIGFCASYFFKKRKASSGNFILFSIIGTISYDAVTGLAIGPLFFHQLFMVALVGQIPFTVLHLLGNIAFSLLLSPALYRLLDRQKRRSHVDQTLPLSITQSFTL